MGMAYLELVNTVFNLVLYCRKKKYWCITVTLRFISCRPAGLTSLTGRGRLRLAPYQW